MDVSGCRYVCKCVSRQGTGGETPQQRDHAVCRMRWRTRMRENTTDEWEKKEEKQELRGVRGEKRSQEAGQGQGKCQAASSRKVGFRNEVSLPCLRVLCSSNRKVRPDQPRTESRKTGKDDRDERREGSAPVWLCLGHTKVAVSGLSKAKPHVVRPGISVVARMRARLAPFGSSGLQLAAAQCLCRPVRDGVADPGPSFPDWRRVSFAPCLGPFLSRWWRMIRSAAARQRTLAADDPPDVQGYQRLETRGC